MLWTDKHAPSSIEAWVGNREAFNRIIDFIKKYRRGQSLLLAGPTGTGKTAALELIGRELGYDLLILGFDDLSSKERLERVSEEIKVGVNLFGRKKIVAVEDLEILPGRVISSVVKIIENSPSPVVFVCFDPWEQKLRGIKQRSKLVEFAPLKRGEIMSKLVDIARKEEVTISEKAIKKIVEDSRGDMRSAINDFQSLFYNNLNIEESVMGVREKQIGILDYLKELFSGDVAQSLEDFFYVNLEPNLMFYWIGENIPAADTLEALDYLSKADIARGRISRTGQWSFLNYVRLLLVLGSSSFSKRKSWVKFSFPTRFRMSVKYRVHNYTLKGALSDLSGLTHTSEKKVAGNIMFYSMIAKKFPILSEPKNSKVLCSLSG